MASPGGTASSGGGTRHFAGLDGLRGIAVALVVGVHSGNSLWPGARSWLVQGGPLGVHLFFVLSGFLITTILLGERDRTGTVDLLRFGERRARRLVPALVVLLIALVLIPVERPSLQVAGESALAVLTFTSNQVMKGDASPIGGLLDGRIEMAPETIHTWSLAIEVQFYVLWAAVLWLLARARWSAVRMAALVGVGIVAVAVARAWLHHGGTHWLTLYLSTSTRLDAPLVGALAAVALRAGWLDRVRRDPAVVLGTLGLGLFVLAAFTVTWDRPALDQGLYTALAAAGALPILAVVLHPGTVLDRALAWAPLTWLGRTSYSLYLWHYLLFSKMERAEILPAGPIRLVAGIGLSLLAAWASYALVERRFHRSRPQEGSHDRRDRRRPHDHSEGLVE
jgi:peptidoglycan/LPS O-acetylase OafA/YrhL